MLKTPPIHYQTIGDGNPINITFNLFHANFKEQCVYSPLHVKVNMCTLQHGSVQKKK